MTQSHTGSKRAFLSRRTSASGGLFDRLNAHEQTPDDTCDAAGVWLNSVSDSVRRILNSRPGGAQSSPDFGYEDTINSLDSGAGTIARACAGISRALLNNDPRISAVDVRPVLAFPGQSGLTFEVYVSGFYEEKEIALKFDLQMENSRHFKVSGMRTLD